MYRLGALLHAHEHACIHAHALTHTPTWTHTQTYREVQSSTSTPTHVDKHTHTYADTQLSFPGSFSSSHLFLIFIFTLFFLYKKHDAYGISRTAERIKAEVYQSIQSSPRPLIPASPAPHTQPLFWKPQRRMELDCFRNVAIGPWLKPVLLASPLTSRALLKPADTLRILGGTCFPLQFLLLPYSIPAPKNLGRHCMEIHRTSYGDFHSPLMVSVSWSYCYCEVFATGKGRFRQSGVNCIEIIYLGLL